MQKRIVRKEVFSEKEWAKANARDRYRCRLCGRETDGLLYLLSPAELRRFYAETGIYVSFSSAENLLTLCPACILGRVEKGLNTYAWKKKQVLQNIYMQKEKAKKKGGGNNVF